MNDDPLVRAARALRETTGGVSARDADGRARLLARATLRRKRRRSVALVLLPLAAAFVMSSAWAAVTGRIPFVAAWWPGALPPVTHPIGRGSPAPVRGRAEDIAAPVASAPPAETATTLDTVAPTASDRVVSARRATASRELPGASRQAAPDSASDSEESLYEDAHRAHFVARDPAAALRGWDAYLRAYPDGRFALEARYNRALTLVRLGRVMDARAALAPFAAGSAGGYRENESRALLDALDGGL